MGTRSGAEVGEPGLVRRSGGDDEVVHSAGAAGSTAVFLLAPRSAFLPDPAGGAEVPDLPPRQLLLRGLLYERARGRGGERLCVLQTLQPAHREV